MLIPIIVTAMILRVLTTVTLIASMTPMIVRHYGEAGRREDNKAANCNCGQ